MKLHGTLTANLEDAIASATRLREHPVYAETLAFWGDLLREARRQKADMPDVKRASLDRLIVGLESELASRRQ